MKKILPLILGATLLLSACQANTLSVDDQVTLTHAHGLAVDIVDSSTLYIAGHEGLLMLKDEKKLSRVGENTTDFMGFVSDKKDSNTFYSSGHPSLGGNAGFQKTTDGGKTWQKVSDGINGPVDFHTMTVSPVNADLIYGYYDREIQKSTDGGKTWTSLNTAPDKIFSLLADESSESTLYATTQKGIWVSKDDGNKWDSLAVDLANSTVIGMAQNPFNNQEFLSFSDTLGLAKSSNGGITWTAVGNPPDAVFYFMAFAQSEANLVYEIDQKNAIYKSTDAGSTWNKIY